MIEIIVSGLAGWLAGAAGNWAADRLPGFGKNGATNDARRPERAGLRGLAHAFTLPWYLVRHGVCPHCGMRRPWRTPLLELAMIAAFILAYVLAPGAWPVTPATWSLAAAWLYAAFLLTVLVIDLEHRRVLNIMTAPAAVIALLISLLPGDPAPVQALLGGAIGFGFFFVIALIGRGKMGWGDVKLAGVIGLMTGYPDVLAALFLGAMLGGAAALVLLLTRRAGRKSTMAYAPYLALGALVMVLL